MTRRDLLQSAGFLLAGSQLRAEPAAAPAAGSAWLETCRGLICEAYNPPFYPSFDFQARKAVTIATQLNSDALRYLNRLSDLLFVLARWQAGGDEAPSRER